MRAGRRTFLAQFPSMISLEAKAALPDPGDPAVFERCKLDHAERTRNTAAFALHRDLLRLRREDPAFMDPRPGAVAGAVLDDAAFTLRFSSERGGDRLLVVNLGPDLTLEPACEPLLAAPAGGRWELLWSSELPVYGGGGAYSPADAEGRWKLPAACASVLGGSFHG